MPGEIARCPLCGNRTFQTVVSRRTIAGQIRLRDEFIYARTARRANPSELKDLTDFMHGFPAPLLACSQCGLVIRGESRTRDAHSYEEDPNDLDLMRSLLPRFVESFRHKEAAYRPLLPPNATVLELASHLGGFLQVAAEWNWNAAGLDIGSDTAAFVRSQGFRVIESVIEEAHLPERSFDAVFVWNCFDQLVDPRPTLKAVHRVLKPHGLLVIRVPNVLFLQSQLKRKTDRTTLQALAYNNLLGFPYLYGYTEESLIRLVAQWGFRPVRGFNSELLTMPFPDLTNRIEREETTISRRVAQWSAVTTAASETLTGPWIEVVFRKAGEERSRTDLRPSQLDLRFLSRAA